MHRRLLLLPVLGLACQPPGDDATSDGGTGGPDEGQLAPVFVEPADGELEVPLLRNQLISLAVKNIEPGQTALLANEALVGPLVEPNPLGELAVERLVLHAAGALTPGAHGLQLRTKGDTMELFSQLIQVVVEPVPDRVVTAELGGDRVLPADGIALGAAEQLLALDFSNVQEPRLHVVGTSDAGWDADVSASVVLPGAHPFPEGRPAVTTRALDEGLRIVYRAGEYGERVEGVDWIPGEDSTGPAQTVLDSGDPPFVGAESVSFGAPVVSEGHVLVPALAPRAPDLARPGDRLVVAVPWPDAESAPTRDGAWRLGEALGVDVDLPTPAIHRGPNQPPAVAVRVDGGTLALVVPSPAGASLVLEPIELPTRPLPTYADSLGLVVGALGSRTVGAAGAGQPSGAFISTLGTGARVTRTSLPDPLPEARGPLATTVLDGIVVFLVPMGTAAPVHAIAMTSEAPTVSPLQDVICDQVAVRPTGPGDEIGGADTPGDTVHERAFACLRDRTVRLGTLRAADPS